MLFHFQTTLNFSPSMIVDLKQKIHFISFISKLTIEIKSWRLSCRNEPGTWLSWGLLLVKASWNGFVLIFVVAGTKGLAIGVKGTAAGFRLEFRESSFARLGVSPRMGRLLLLHRVSNSDRSKRFVTLFCLLQNQPNKKHRDTT